MAPPKGPRVLFPKVKEAREALAQKALEIFELQMKIAQEALAAQDFEQANKAVQFLLEHMPKDDEGTRLLDPSVDNETTSSKGAPPPIMLGISLGQRRELPPVEVIDVTDGTKTTTP